MGFFISREISGKKMVIRNINKTHIFLNLQFQAFLSKIFIPFFPSFIEVRINAAIKGAKSRKVRKKV